MVLFAGKGCQFWAFKARKEAQMRRRDKDILMKKIILCLLVKTFKKQSAPKGLGAELKPFFQKPNYS
jgi:hypothetical protein